MSIAKKDLTPKELYDKEHTKVYTFRVVKSTESDIMQKLDGQKNKAGYIKSLIREDIIKRSEQSDMER